MADAETRQAGPAVWEFDDHPGYRRAIETAGAVAAPLLAGFAFTLLALIVPTLNEQGRTSGSGSGDEVGAGTALASGMPEVAAGLLLLAGLALVFSVQAAIGVRYHNHRPSDLVEWYPEYFPDSADEAPRAAEMLGGWSSRDWPAVQVGNRWYGGWPRQYLYLEIKRADTYAKWMRRLYHLGIVSLLLGVTALVWPPAEAASAARWALVGVGVSGVIVEATWVLLPVLRPRRGS